MMDDILKVDEKTSPAGSRKVRVLFLPPKATGVVDGTGHPARCLVKEALHNRIEWVFFAYLMFKSIIREAMEFSATIKYPKKQRVDEKAVPSH